MGFSFSYKSALLLAPNDKVRSFPLWLMSLRGAYVRLGNLHVMPDRGWWPSSTSSVIISFGEIYESRQSKGVDFVRVCKFPIMIFYLSIYRG